MRDDRWLDYHWPRFIVVSEPKRRMEDVPLAALRDRLLPRLALFQPGAEFLIGFMSSAHVAEVCDLV